MIKFFLISNKSIIYLTTIYLEVKDTLFVNEAYNTN
jgi:hypothetical protein